MAKFDPNMASADDDSGIPPVPALPPICETGGHMSGDEFPRFFNGQNCPPMLRHVAKITQRIVTTTTSHTRKRRRTGAHSIIINADDDNDYDKAEGNSNSNNENESANKNTTTTIHARNNDEAESMWRHCLRVYYKMEMTTTMMDNDDNGQ
jgi:hypothetical protein